MPHPAHVLLLSAPRCCSRCCRAVTTLEEVFLRVAKGEGDTVSSSSSTAGALCELDPTAN